MHSRPLINRNQGGSSTLEEVPVDTLPRASQTPSPMKKVPPNPASKQMTITFLGGLAILLTWSDYS